LSTISRLIHKRHKISQIPGTKTVQLLEKLPEATRRNITQEELALIDTTLPIGWAHGNRYSISQSKAVEQYC